jgi:hypothetical protein
MKKDLLKKIAVTYELCAGRTLSEPAAEAFARMLDRYPPAALSQALDTCVRECRGALSPGDVITRVEQLDGRPTAEEAWAMLPSSESASVCWTTETAEAFGACRSLIGVDTYGARQAFCAAYKRSVQANRLAGLPAKWELSLGYGQSEREACVSRALSEGKITQQRALALCPALDVPRLLGDGNGDAAALVAALSKRMAI